MYKIAFGITALALVLSVADANARGQGRSNQISGGTLNSEPAAGTLARGAVVFVNDGSCGPGKVKRIVAGDNSIGKKRQTSCVRQ